MGKIYILDKTGHTELAWDIANEQATAIARDKFNQLAAEGHLMTEVSGGQGQATQVREFHPEAEEIMAVRNLAGG